MKKVLITGATGFIGSNLLSKLQDEIDISVLALKRSSSSGPVFQLNKEPEWLSSELENVQSESLKSVEILVHLAAHSANTPYDNLENCIKYNYENPILLFQKAYENGIKRFIVTGTCFEYGESCNHYDYLPTDAPLIPNNSYAQSKTMFFNWLKDWCVGKEIQIVYLRLFQVFGPGEQSSRLWPMIIDSAQQNKDIILSPGEQIRDFIHVNDVVSKILDKIKEEKVSWGLLSENVGTGHGITVREFVERWYNSLDGKGKLKFGELPYKPGEYMRIVAKL